MSLGSVCTRGNNSVEEVKDKGTRDSRTTSTIDRVHRPDREEFKHVAETLYVLETTVVRQDRVGTGVDQHQPAAGNFPDPERETEYLSTSQKRVGSSKLVEFKSMNLAVPGIVEMKTMTNECGWQYDQEGR